MSKKQLYGILAIITGIAMAGIYIQLIILFHELSSEAIPSEYLQTIRTHLALSYMLMFLGAGMVMVGSAAVVSKDEKCKITPIFTIVLVLVALVLSIVIISIDDGGELMYGVAIPLMFVKAGIILISTITLVPLFSGVKIPNRLEQLKRLRDEGTLTENEYKEQALKIIEEK